MATEGMAGMEDTRRERGIKKTKVPVKFLIIFCSHMNDMHG